MPKVSVIVPNYNHARYLRQRMDTVLGQTYRDFEVILLDDCSTDESREIIAEYASSEKTHPFKPRLGHPEIRVELNQVNSGSTFKQWNKGIRLARGEYVWVAESDDYADARLLEGLAAVLDGDPQVSFAYCRSWRVVHDDQPEGYADWYLAELDARHWTEDFVADGREECARYFVGNNAVPNASSVVFRKSVYERVGGADESLRACGDWKLWVLMALQGKIAYLAEPLNYYREHDATVRSKASAGVIASEHMAMVRWMRERVAPSQDIIQHAYQRAAISWIPPVLNRRVPVAVRWGLLKEAMATDPHALRRLVRPILTMVRLKAAKEFRGMRQRIERRAS